LKTFSQEKDEWIENFKTKFSQVTSNANLGPIPDFTFVMESHQWESEKAQLLRNWSEETDALTMVIRKRKKKKKAKKKKKKQKNNKKKKKRGGGGRWVVGKPQLRTHSRLQFCRGESFF
jgi:hypothetical protein